MMRERQIHAARMHVHFFPEHRACHHRALDVPPGPPWSPRAWPLGLADLARLPKREIRLLALGISSGSGERALALIDERAVALRPRLEARVDVCIAAIERGRVEVNATAGLVGISVFDDALK